MFNYNHSKIQIFPVNCQEHYSTLQALKQKNLVTENYSNSKSVKLFAKLYQLNKKYFLNVWGILFLLTVFLNLYFLQPIDWEKFEAVFSKTRKSHSFTGIIIFGTFFFIINDLFLAKWAFSIYISGSKKLTKSIATIEWLKLLSITFFIRSITPFSIGSEPYIIFWLKKKGIPLRQASAIVSSLTVSWFLAQGIITWPSFITLQINHNLVSPENIDSKYSWVVITGLIVDIISTLFVFTISYCQRIHYFFGLVKLWFNQIFKLKNSETLAKAELKHKYLDNKSFKKEFKRIFFNVTTIKVMLLFTIQNVLNYSLYAWLAVVMLDENFIDSFHIINISTTSNNFIPTPGSEGSIQFTIAKMNSLAGKKAGAQLPQPAARNNESLQEVIFLWRWFQKYKPFLFSVAFIVVYFLLIKCKSKMLKRKIENLYLNRRISPSLISWYTVNGSSTLN